MFYKSIYYQQLHDRLYQGVKNLQEAGAEVGGAVEVAVRLMGRDLLSIKNHRRKNEILCSCSLIFLIFPRFSFCIL